MCIVKTKHTVLLSDATNFYRSLIWLIEMDDEKYFFKILGYPLCTTNCNVVSGNRLVWGASGNPASNFLFSSTIHYLLKEKMKKKKKIITSIRFQLKKLFLLTLLFRRIFFNVFESYIIRNCCK